MSDSDNEEILRGVRENADTVDGVVVVHGTDRLAKTGEILHRAMDKAGGWRVPVVLTGAMRPYELRNSDALQNVTEALLAAQVLDPGVYCVMHSRILPFPGVEKDHAGGTFIHLDPDT